MGKFYRHLSANMHSHGQKIRWCPQLVQASEFTLQYFEGVAMATALVPLFSLQHDVGREITIAAGVTPALCQCLVFGLLGV
mmetsp:Transcript_63254/g.110400  ORF Transcript_63254/g.110400 Transcript_63254/m.110400 type:complete len:81 (+) Transcript_63254:19-261(+)